MRKSTHFFGPPLYSQVLKQLDKSKTLQISKDLGVEGYTKFLDSQHETPASMPPKLTLFDLSGLGMEKTKSQPHKFCD